LFALAVAGLLLRSAALFSCRRATALDRRLT